MNKTVGRGEIPRHYEETPYNDLKQMVQVFLIFLLEV